MPQSVKLTDAICLLQLVISSTLIHALGDPSQAPTEIRTQCKRWMTYQLSYPSRTFYKIQLNVNYEL